MHTDNGRDDDPLLDRFSTLDNRLASRVLHTYRFQPRNSVEWTLLRWIARRRETGCGCPVPQVRSRASPVHLDLLEEPRGHALLLPLSADTQNLLAAGVIVIGLALRVAAKVRAPLVCRMPVLSGLAHSNKPATRLEMMLAGVAFATRCMACFGSALVVGMVVYIGLAQSAFYGALVLFLFSLGMGVPLVIAAVAMARALPLLLKLETAVPWMGLFSAILMAGFGTLLISGNYMVVAEWTQRLVSGSASLPNMPGGVVFISAVAGSLGLVALLMWITANGRARRSQPLS